MRSAVSVVDRVSSSALREIEHLIDEHLAEKLTLEVLCNYAQLSAHDLRTALGPRRGAALRSLVAQRRVRKLATLIVEGSKVEVAMLSVGLKNWNNVVEQCRREFGCLPRELRNKPNCLETGLAEGGKDHRHSC